MAYEAKTKPTKVSVEAFLEQVEPPVRREDGKALCALMAEVSGEAPRMWGPTIVGFGSYKYRYESGAEGVSLKMGFSPRKPKLVLYLPKTAEREGLLARLGKYSHGKSCLYITRLADVDAGVLRELVTTSW
ncbi:MAG TPA: DUF1801 domain-containing protein, partial [Caulobacteraceae bacterium]|nr:DUF1801 domain-containing protein [Caulobacteraceae bacterium]